MRELGFRMLAGNEQAQSLLLMLSVAGLAVGAVLAAFIIVDFVRVLNELSLFAAAVANGDFAYEMKTREKGEISAIIGSRKQIPAVLNAMIEVAKGLANDISTGKLRTRGDASALSGSFIDLGNSINNYHRGLHQAY